MQKWIIQPINTPSIIRNCNKCGCASSFLCSGSFRVNANGKNLDVWLIYKCKHCDTTLNIEILSRIKPNKIDKTLYLAFLKNDKQTAAKYAFDVRLLSKNKAVTSYEDIKYEVIKTQVGDDDSLIEITSQYDLGLRIDKLLSEQLNISRTKIKQMFENNEITSPHSLSCKTKLKGTIRLQIQTGFILISE